MSVLPRRSARRERVPLRQNDHPTVRRRSPRSKPPGRPRERVGPLPRGHRRAAVPDEARRAHHADRASRSAVPQEADADLDEPLGRERPTPDALRPPPSRPFPSRCRGLDVRDDRRFARVVRPPGGRRPLRPGRRGPERPRSRPSPESRDRGGQAVGRNPHAPRKKPRACGQRRAVPGYLFREPNDGRSGGRRRPGPSPSAPWPATSRRWPRSSTAIAIGCGG